MAEELGSGFVSILPSMRGFSKLLKADLKKSLAGMRDIEVPVKPVLDRDAFARALSPGRRAIQVPVEVDRNSFRRSLLGLSKDSRSTIGQKVKVDVDKERRGNLLQSLLGLGDSGVRAAMSAGNAVGGAFTSAVGGVLGNPLTGLPAMILAAIAAAMTAVPAAIIGSAATVAATLAGAGLGGIFLGAFLLKDDPEIKKAVTGLFGGIMSSLVEAAAPLKGPFLEAIGILKSSFAGAVPGIRDFFTALSAGKDGKAGPIQELARGLGNAFKSLSDTGALKKFGEGANKVLMQLGMALPDIGNSISQLMISFGNAAPAAADFFGKLLRAVAGGIRFVGGAVGWLANKWTWLVNFVKGVKTAVSDVWSGLQIMFNAVVGAITANMAKVKPLKDLIVGFFTDIGKKIGLIPEKVSGLVTTVKGIPGRVKTALGDLGSLLLSSGKALVQGLINGIQSKLGDLGNMASNMAKTVWNYMQHSPAKMGPLAGRGNTFYSGQAMATGLAAGMSSRLPAVNSAASQLAATAAFGIGGSAARAAAAPSKVQLEFIGGDDRILSALREAIRVRNGGDVQKLLGSK